MKRVISIFSILFLFGLEIVCYPQPNIQSNDFSITLWVGDRASLSDPPRLYWNPNQLVNQFKKDEFPAFWLGYLKEKWTPEADVLPAGNWSFKPLPQQPPLVLDALEPGFYAARISVGVKDASGPPWYPISPKAQKSNWVVFQATDSSGMKSTTSSNPSAFKIGGKLEIMSKGRAATSRGHISGTIVNVNSAERIITMEPDEGSTIMRMNGLMWQFLHAKDITKSGVLEFYVSKESNVDWSKLIPGTRLSFDCKEQQDYSVEMVNISADR